MHGITTIHKLNRQLAEAEAILAKHAAADEAKRLRDLNTPVEHSADREALPANK